MELSPILSSKFVAFLVSGSRSVFIEFQIVEKQHAMMKTNTQNYANVITNILRKNRLPELYNILQDIPTKQTGKKRLKTKYRNIVPVNNLTFTSALFTSMQSFGTVFHT
jgi:hypothetical protein